MTAGHPMNDGAQGSTEAGAVVALADRSARGKQALSWAASEAARRRAPLQVVVADDQRTPQERQTLFADAVASIRHAAPGISVLAHTGHGPTVQTLRELSAEAAALVVPASLPSVTIVVADSYCPVFVVPEDAAHPAAERGPVVLGVAPWTGEHVIDLAFREAELRRAGLFAVRTWFDARIDLGRPRSDAIQQWDPAEARVRRELELSLSAWSADHPDVHVETVVVADRAAHFLLSVTGRARLLVLGRTVRGALLTGIVGFPVSNVLHRARCPVLVVPAEGPPLTTWLSTMVDTATECPIPQRSQP